MKKMYLIATIMALLTAVAVYFFAGELKQLASKKNDTTVDVVTALSDINENTVITAEMIILKKVPKQAVVNGAIYKIEDVIGKLNTVKLFAGEQIIEGKIYKSGSDEKKTLALNIKENMRAITIPVDETTGLAGYVTDGDFADILITTETANKTVITYSIEGLKILKAGDTIMQAAEEKKELYKSLTLEVTREQSLQIANGFANGVVRVTLRSMLDKSLKKKG